MNSNQTGLTFSAAQSSLATLRTERRRLVECGRELAAELESEKRSQTSEGSKRRAELRDKISKLKADIESVEGEISLKETFLRRREEQVGGLGLKKQQLEAALKSGYYDTLIGQAQNSLRAAEAQKQAAFEEINNLESQIEELVR
jgi:chromosome segregation ATPase